jgi:hypothetical protein
MRAFSADWVKGSIAAGQQGGSLDVVCGEFDIYI